MSDTMIQMISTINYECYVDGSRYLGSASIDLPQITYMTSETSGAGIAGKIDFPVLSHLENVETTLHWRTVSNRPVNLFTQDSVMLSLRGAMEKYDASNGKIKVMAVRIDLRGFSIENTLGKFEPGAQTDTETKLHCDWIKIEIDGTKLFEHDKFNYVHYVKGKDFLTDVRKALGLK